MTTTVNYGFGAGVLSPSTGIVLNNEMDDFSTPTELSPDRLPPAPANFIKPNKRPLSSMTPIIVVKVSVIKLEVTTNVWLIYLQKGLVSCIFLTSSLDNCIFF